MLTPRFLLTRSVDVVLSRHATGTYDASGDYIAAVPTTVTIKANVQPVLKGTDILLLPEAFRTKKVLKLYSSSEIRQRSEHGNDWEADRFTWEGETYEVMRVIRYNMGVLNHFKALAVIVDPE